jgi:hypothetical protein
MKDLTFWAVVLAILQAPVTVKLLLGWLRALGKRAESRGTLQLSLEQSKDDELREIRRGLESSLAQMRAASEAQMVERVARIEKVMRLEFELEQKDREIAELRRRSPTP